MRGHIGKTLKAAKIAAAVALFIFCAVDTNAASLAVKCGINRCMDMVIPSLFAMMAASSVMISSGITELVPAWAGKISRFVFGMSERELPIFSFSMFAGYPVGAKMLCEEYNAGRITKERAEKLAGLCFGAGPAFIFGCAANGSAGLLILISTVSANILAALIISGSLRTPAAQKPSRRGVSISADMLTDCVLRSGKAMADICVMITAFSVFTAFLVRIGAMAAAGELLVKLPCLDRRSGEALTAALIDVTNVGSISCGGQLLPYVSGAVSFGGICVLLQIAVLTARKLSLRPFIRIRLTAAVLSGVICRLLLPFYTDNEVVEAAMTHTVGYSADSAVPSVMLIIMTLLLMWEFGGKSKGRSAYST